MHINKYISVPSRHNHLVSYNYTLLAYSYVYIGCQRYTYHKVCSMYNTHTHIVTEKSIKHQASVSVSRMHMLFSYTSTLQCMLAHHLARCHYWRKHDFHIQTYYDLIALQGYGWGRYYYTAVQYGRTSSLHLTSRTSRKRRLDLRSTPKKFETKTKFMYHY